MKYCFPLVAATLLAACTSVQVQEIDPTLQLSHVCIESNPKVIVGDFLPVVRKGFERHGITTEVYEGSKPEYCDYHMTYTALQSWDISTYMHHAELQLYQTLKPIAYAEYHLNGKGGFALTKWASVESKMDPVIDTLLAKYTPQMVDSYRSSIPRNSNPIEDNDSTAQKLRGLKSWFEDGLITEEEYNAEREKVLNR